MEINIIHVNFSYCNVLLDLKLVIHWVDIHLFRPGHLKGVNDVINPVLFKNYISNIFLNILLYIVGIYLPFVNPLRTIKIMVMSHATYILSLTSYIKVNEYLSLIGNLLARTYPTLFKLCTWIWAHLNFFVHYAELKQLPNLMKPATFHYI